MDIEQKMIINFQDTIAAEFMKGRETVKNHKNTSIVSQITRTINIVHKTGLESEPNINY